MGDPVEKGSICSVEFPFIEDPSRRKRRPVLILASNLPNDAVLACMITTKSNKYATHGGINLNPSDFVSGSLPKACSVIPFYIQNLPISAILEVKGKLKEEKLREIRRTVLSYIL